MKIFYFIFIFASPLFFLSQELAWKNIGVKEGLPSSEVYQVLQDKKGFIWFATDAGAGLYNGEKITTFTSREGLYENVVLGIYEDSKGRIWFRGLSGSLSFYENGTITSINANETLYKMLKPNGIITSLFLGIGDTLYCGTSHDLGILKIAPQNKYEKVVIEKAAFGNSSVFILQNKTGTDLIYGRNSSAYDTSTVQYMYASLVNHPAGLQPFPGKIAGNYLRYSVGANGKIYVANKMNLFTFSGTSYSITKFPAPINASYTDRYNNLWVGIYKHGLLLYKNSDLSAKPLHFLKNCSISSVFLDKENSLWVSTLEKGVMCSLNTNIFLEKDADTRVGCFFLDDTLLYIGLNNQSKILRVSAGSGKVVEQNVNIHESADLLGMTRLGKRWIYAATYGILSSPPGNLPPISNRAYLKAMVRLNDSVMGGVTRSVLFISNMKNNYWSKPLPDYALCLAQTSEKKILMGTNKMGILELRDGNFLPFPNAEKGLHTRVNSIEEGRKNEIWAGTNEEGIFIFYGTRLINISEKDGLASNKIYNIAFDDQGNAWAATNKGLSRVAYDPVHSRCQVTSFNETNGLPSNEILKIIFFDNKLFCAPRQGLFYFAPHDLNENTVPPEILVSSCMMNSLPWDYSAPKLFVHNQNNLDITLNRLTYKGNGLANFTYRLSGFDTIFRYTSYGHIAYTNLPPGDYVFIAYALNNSGTRSAQPVRIVFTIDKPMWMKWWFILCAFLILLFSVYITICHRLKIIQRRADERNEVNKKLAEYKMNALQAQMNPHFVFNAINSIQHFILNNKAEPAYHYLAQFARLIRLVLNNSMQKSISLDQEIETLELYLELESIRFSIPFKYSINIDERIDGEDIHIAPMLIQPFVENAIKHGLMPRKDSAELTISFHLKNSSLYVMVCDNGIGRAASQKNRKDHAHVSTAISNTLERAQLGNEYAGEGAEIKITDLFDKEHNPSGTRVEIIIPVIH